MTLQEQIEKKAREYSMNNANDIVNPLRKYTANDIIDETNEAFLAGANAILEAMRWRDMKEELPTEQGHYLVRVLNSFPKNCDVVVAEFYDDNNTFYSESGDYPIMDAVSWRPINLEDIEL